jgi:AcrR family transcriptional regulator
LTNRTSGPARWGTITRDQVIDAATVAVTSGNYESMTIRSLAREMGVAPMSLYRHVRNRDDLLDEVVERLLRRRWRPRHEHQNWREWVVEAADRLRRLLTTYPAALHVYLSHPVVSPSALKRMEVMLQVLSEAGFDESAAQRAYAAIHTYTVGFGALEAGRSRQLEGNPTGESDAMSAKLAAFTTPQQFTAGLLYLLDGLTNMAEGESVLPSDGSFQIHLSDAGSQPVLKGSAP